MLTSNHVSEDLLQKTGIGHFGLEINHHLVNQAEVADTRILELLVGVSEVRVDARHHVPYVPV